MEAIDRELGRSDIVAHNACGGGLGEKLGEQSCELLVRSAHMFAAMYERGELGIVTFVADERECFEHGL